MLLESGAQEPWQEPGTTGGLSCRGCSHRRHSPCQKQSPRQSQEKLSLACTFPISAGASRQLHQLEASRPGGLGQASSVVSSPPLSGAGEGEEQV